MSVSIIQFLVSAFIIVIAGAALTQFGDIIAEKTKLGHLLVGTILIAGATSLPELGVNINSVRLGAADMAVGDLVGSSLMNLMILAILDLTRYSRGQLVSNASRNQALVAGTSIGLTAIVAIFIHLGPQLETVEIWRVGPGSFVLLVAYLLGLRLIHRGRTDREGGSTDKKEPTWPRVLRRLQLKGAIIGFVVAAATILAAAPFLAAAAKDIAESTGLGGTFFGSTFVALCTSLPEVVTTFAAVRMGAYDLALGNILGSNCFNMLLLVPLDLVSDDSLLSAVAPAHTYTALCVIVVTTVIILGQLYPVERKKPLLEPDAWLALVLILAAWTGLYFVK